MQQSVDNPYRAPRAEVDDFEPREENDRGPRPPQVTVAVIMFWIVLVMQIASLVYNWQFLRYQTGTVFMIGVLVSVFWVLTAFLVAMIERGRNWARITYLVMFLMLLPFYSLTIYYTFTLLRAPLAALPTLAQTLVQLGALVLLFVGPGRQWFRRQPA